jgi:hypothetical protein
MKTGRRLFARIAIFAVAFGALWPLVSAARPGPPRIPSFICTQSGFQHAQVPGGTEDDGFHCPLCIASMALLPDLPPRVQGPAPAPAPRVEPFTSALDLAFSARPPPSRAPPVS